MLELVALITFLVILLVCVLLGHSILYPLLIGYGIFFAYGLIRKFTVAQMLGMSWSGIKHVKNILITFLLIGMITAVWRDCGTIPFLIYHSSKIIVPSAFILVAFLLCCLISTLTGTALGAAATVGVICMTIGNAMGINPIFVGGAILSGVYLGDRCSLMSTSALLVGELTSTDIYTNVKNMLRPSVVPFLVSCVLYLLLGLGYGNGSVTTGIWGLFPANFSLNWVVVLPALLIIVLCMCKVSVKIAMASSILAGSAISLGLQGTSPSSLLGLLFTGFQTPEPQLAAMMNGGGVMSMVNVMVIVCVSSSYLGIFECTGILNRVRDGVMLLNRKYSSYVCVLVTSVLTCMVACNQALSIMLTHFLCKDTTPDREKLALHMENSVVIIAPLIPWSIASVVPLAAAGAPTASILAAFYLLLLPLWCLVPRKGTPMGKAVPVIKVNGASAPVSERH